MAGDVNHGKNAREDEAGVGPGEVTCERCGVCCSKWQAPVEENEVISIAGALGLPVPDFIRDYLENYPFRSGIYLLRHRDGRCIFLRHEGELTSCAIQEFKPAVCREWKPGKEKSECREGAEKRSKEFQTIPLP